MCVSVLSVTFVSDWLDVADFDSFFDRDMKCLNLCVSPLFFCDFFGSVPSAGGFVFWPRALVIGLDDAAMFLPPV